MIFTSHENFDFSFNFLQSDWLNGLSMTHMERKRWCFFTMKGVNWFCSFFCEKNELFWFSWKNNYFHFAVSLWHNFHPWELRQNENSFCEVENLRVCHWKLERINFMLPEAEIWNSSGSASKSHELWEVIWAVHQHQVHENAWNDKIFSFSKTWKTTQCLTCLVTVRTKRVLCALHWQKFQLIFFWNWWVWKS